MNTIELNEQISQLEANVEWHQCYIQGLERMIEHSNKVIDMDMARLLVLKSKLDEEIINEAKRLTYERD